jgi:superfamily II DNA or RNA helicase
MILLPDINYPLDNPDFNSDLTRYEDFNIKSKVYNPSTQQEVEELADKLCNSAIELSTYQTVVRNFLSNETPYNGLLLFHGLGTGKTCSAITIAEEHRAFLKQSGLGTTEGRKQREKKIYILGGPNIKSNFRKQLFDASQLSKRGKEWICNSCLGNAFLREINPTGIDITKDEIVKRVDEVIKRHYKFMGYIEFANTINAIKEKSINKKIPMQDLISKEYQHCMIIIDEVHNIKSDDSVGTITSSQALDLITTHTTIKLLLLSATPMFNQPTEIVWIFNLLNRNDKRYTISESDFFVDGELKPDQTDNFIHFFRGYVSFVKGENPYTFPYRVYPTYFDDRKISMPTIGLKNESFEPIKTKVYPVEMSDYQFSIYNEAMKQLETADFNPSSIQHVTPLFGILNMTYPNNEVELQTCMKQTQGKYEYYPKHEKCFENLTKYSAKIHVICEQVKKSTGIVLIYSRMIQKGVIPMALALESIGGKNIQGNLMKPGGSFSYCLLTGKTELSSENANVIDKINAKDNMNGEKIKVVVISEAASEGVDFKNIRQIHIMDPWWHLNRNEQIIGRGIRLCSHKNLPFSHRNAQIFLYVSIYKNQELLDHYFYRYAEDKAKKVGVVTRILKENAMDCIMNHEQFKTVESMNLTVSQTLSDGKKIDYSIGDTSFSVMCDFMDCDYKCSYKEQPVSIDSTIFNLNRTIDRILSQFKHGYVYTIDDLLYEFNLGVPVSKHQLYEA